MNQRSLIMLIGLSMAVITSAQSPVSVVEQVRRSRDAAAAGNVNESLALARDAVRQDPAYGEAWRQLATMLARTENRSEALQAFETATKLNPNDAPAWRDYGWILWAEGRRPEAVQAFEKAVALNIPQKEDLAIQVLASYSEQGKPDEALEIFQRWVPGSSVLDPAVKLVEKGRTVAARPLLEKAWTAKEKPKVSGLYLAYVNAVNGTCSGAYEQLTPFLNDISKKTDITLLNMAMETLYVCSDNTRLQEALSRVESALAGRPEADKRITDILEKAAEEQRFRRDPRRALELYRRVLSRDPGRVSWIFAATLAQTIEGDASALALMNEVLEKTQSPAVRHGIEGRLAEREEVYGEAARLYALSLAADPMQPQLRENYFRMLVRLGRLDDAHGEAEWFAGRIAEGEPMLRSYLAEMWSSLAEHEKALDLWQMLHLGVPDLPYYAVETAQTMFQLCDPENAIAVLENAGNIADYSQAHELLAEIEAALARPDAAMQRAATGIENKPSRGLYRQHAEYAELAGAISEATLASSAAFLEEDPGNSSIALLHGRQLWALGLTNEATAWAEKLVARNPAMLPALLFLKDSASLRREFAEAAEYARAASAVIPTSVDIGRRYALALAEYERWHRAFRRLRPAADQDPVQAVPVLAYRLVTDCAYPGRNNVAQIRAHITRLAAEDFLFVLPDNMEPQGTQRRVMIMLLDADRKAVEAVDGILSEFNVRAVYAGNTAILTRNVPDKPTPEQLRQLTESGRWALASSGPEDNAARPVTADDVLGNPLTHRVFVQGVQEAPGTFANRVNATIAASAASLGDRSPKLFIYPGGDFGQLSLDLDPAAMNTLRDAVTKHFDYGMYFSDPGFITPKHDDLRLPARVVPPHWDEHRLADHVLRGNPITRAQLDLAKMLYWNRQHEAANAWFERAAASGADPVEVQYNWGANAYQQGDLPTSLRKLREAAQLDPASERTRVALERAEEMKKPEARAFAHGWKDNEDRAYFQWGGDANVFVVDRIRLGAFGDYNRWERDDLGNEEGHRGGVQGLFYVDRATWLDLRFWRLWMDELPDRNGRLISLRLPNTLLSGHVELVAAREELETVEALRADIFQNRYAVQTYSRLLDVVDLYANLTQLERTDDNDTTMLDGRAVYRIREWPFIGAGYLFRFGDSDFDPPEYWAPEKLEQHQLYGNIRGVYGPVNVSVSGQAGYAREIDTDWRFVWGARASADLRINRHLSVRADGSYFEGPIYERFTWTLGAAARF